MPKTYKQLTYTIEITGHRKFKRSDGNYQQRLQKLGETVIGERPFNYNEFYAIPGLKSFEIFRLKRPPYDDMLVVPTWRGLVEWTGDK